tara:strand:+ start:50 stop:394 length:345 start_codon:yes stop_codon:yes gene_type:complete
MNKQKKYCFALDLKNDPQIIQTYIDYHKNVWPGIYKSIKDSGIKHLEIFHTHDRLFMVIEGNENFSLEQKAKMDSENPLVKEWEELMWKYQQALPNTKPGIKWVLMDKIFDLNE